MTMPLTLNLDDTALQALDRLTSTTGNSRDWLVSRALEAYADLESWQTEKIIAGIAAADEGRFATEGQVERVRAKFAAKA